MKKKSKFAIAVMTIGMLLGTSAYAATANFEGKLPANQGDTEISTVGRTNKPDAFKYFNIKITSLDSEYTSVRAWTEGWTGSNYSNPYNEAELNVITQIAYDSVPSKGDNVTLNLDNPVYTSSSVAVKGNWNPN
ncbi:hypothetical protein [uncultured Brevibacillus sp.]|uniref:hypothetical protein n=1 Tax=uncultured Brevibacillus sp. TaxID=169970 RepID=UPI002596B4C2|nr:hypothetical protein [uncultured Brevibacillus sp.]